MPVDRLMVMLKNVFQMLREYQVINILIKIPMYIYLKRMILSVKTNCFAFLD